MLRWFRRQKPPTDERARTPEPAAPAPQDTVSPVPAKAGQSDAAPKKRRRGSRGGRGRKRTGTGAAAQAKTQAEGEAKPAPATPKQEKARPERRPAPRKQRAPRRRTPPRRPPLPPAKRELLISVDVGEQRVAVVEDDKVAEAYLERPERRSIAGNIYKGTVDNVLPGMEAAFIEIGLEKNGFLYVDEVIAPELEGKSTRRESVERISASTPYASISGAFSR